jgi:hypothetical protein
MKKSQNNNHKIVHLEQIWKARREKDNTVAILKDTKRIAMAIEKRTCVLCNKMKMCVNRTGLCAACYSTITPKEKRVADEEARHKRIEVTVTDDRWEKPRDR